jgi:urease accessory protein
MLTVGKCIAGSKGLASVLLKRAPQVELPWELRSKSRFEATDSSGRPLGVFLPRGNVLRGGDTLVAEDGSLVRVVAANEPVLEVRHCQAHGSLFDLLRAAYHLGNRHVALELKPDHLKLEPDHVLAEMLRAMHLIVNETQAPFEPEAGAYAQGHGGHGHGHGGHEPHGTHGAHAHDGHPHGHEQDHGHAHDHGHDHPHDHDHEH